jgi:acyl-CoA hydrolase
MPAFYITASRIFLAAFLSLVITACADRHQFSPLPPNTPVLAFGDSVTAGVGAAAGLDYPARLAATTGWQVINAGVSGDTARQARKRLASLLGTHQPALVIVELGGNDFLRQTPAAKVREYLQEIIREARASGALVALVAVPRLSLLRASVGALSDSPIYAELAAAEGVLLIPGIFSDILSNESLRADEIHPNARGYQQLALGIHAALMEAGLSLASGAD